jgi:hypothetical protein
MYILYLQIYIVHVVTHRGIVKDPAETSEAEKEAEKQKRSQLR